MKVCSARAVMALRFRLVSRYPIAMILMQILLEAEAESELRIRSP